MASTPTFYTVPVLVGTTDLSTSYQTAITGAASVGSDIVALTVTNEAGTACTLFIADANDVVLGAINVPASAGQTSASYPIDLLQPGFGMPGLEHNPFGGYMYSLGASENFRVKVSTVNGSHVRLRWKTRTF